VQCSAIDASLGGKDLKPGPLFFIASVPGRQKKVWEYSRNFSKGFETNLFAVKLTRNILIIILSVAGCLAGPVLPGSSYFI
jgi:hypothetical protein